MRFSRGSVIGAIRQPSPYSSILTLFNYLQIDLTILSKYQCIDVGLRCKGEYEHSEKYKYCNLNSPEQWRALGEAVANNNTIGCLDLIYHIYLVIEMVKPETKVCLSEFYQQLKKSKSIKRLLLYLPETVNRKTYVLHSEQLFNLDYLLKINKNMTVMISNKSGGRIPHTSQFDFDVHSCLGKQSGRGSQIGRCWNASDCFFFRRSEMPYMSFWRSFDVY